MARSLEATQEKVPSLDQIRKKILDKFDVRACLWQVKVVETILAREKDLVLVAGTAMGKTLTYLAPIYFSPHGSLQVIVTPLNLLGKQNAIAAGVHAIFISAESATAENFMVCYRGL